MLFSRHRAQYLPVAGLVFSVIGLIYSLVMSFGAGAEALCLTSGCDIVQDFRVFGISPWWASAAMFALLAALCFLRMRLAARLAAAAFLAGDCVFLAIMFFVAPCSSCLIGGFIIFCAWLALRLDRARFAAARRLMAGAISGVWLLLFVLNLGLAVNELVPAWELNGADGADKKISVFFSPSCPACREAVSLFSGRAVFYPVAENERDYRVIADLDARVAAGQSVSRALEAVLAEQEAGTYQPPKIGILKSISNKIKVMRNQAAVLRHGYSSLPVLVFEGLPAAWAGQRPEAPASDPAAAPQTDPSPAQGSPDLPPELLPGFDSTLECGRANEKPCDDASAGPQNGAGNASPRQAD